VVGIAGGWIPDQPLTPGLALLGAVAVVATLSLLGSLFLSTTANGVAMFMLFGAGLMATLLNELGDELDSGLLEATTGVVAWVLPWAFERRDL